MVRVRLDLLPDAERTEDQVEDIVGRGRAGDFVERAQGIVEIEQQHLVGDMRGYCVVGGIESGEGVCDQFLMADVGQESAFDLCPFSAEMPEDRPAQVRDALAC